MIGIVSLTWVFAFGCVDNSTIGKDNFVVQDIVRSPAVLGTQETHTTYESLVINSTLIAESHTSEHISTNSDSSHSTSNNSPTSSLKTFLGLFP